MISAKLTEKINRMQQVRFLTVKEYNTFVMLGYEENL